MTSRARLRRLHDIYIRQRIAGAILGIARFAGAAVLVGSLCSVKLGYMELADSFRPALFGLGFFVGSMGLGSRLELVRHRTWRKIRKLSWQRDHSIAVAAVVNAQGRR